jgi:hypothetical protein
VGDRRPDDDLGEGAGGDPVLGDGGGDAGEAEPGVCGNGVAEADEACDGADLKTVTSCADLSFGSGVPTCMATCVAFDLSTCSGPGGSCNGGMASGREQCDGVDLRGFDCEALGFASGDLTCNGNCSFNVAGCVP